MTTHAEQQAKESDLVKDHNDLDEELYGISTRALLRGLKSSQILKENERLKQQGRALDEALLTDKQALKEVEEYAKALGNPNIIDNILMGGLIGSAALKHELVELSALRRAGLDIDNTQHIELIVQGFKKAFIIQQPQHYIPFHLEALKAELEYAADQLRAKGIDVELGMIAKALYHLDVEEQDMEVGLTGKLDKTTFELDALNISYPFKVPIPEELKNAL
jgi:aryl carrier-like protein